jgi:acetylornithine aminotransferase
VRFSPVLTELGVYPFARLEQLKRETAARGVPIVDFGVGDPREPTDPRIRQALVEGLRETMGYPLSVGLPELREAVAGWLGRRFGVSVDAQTEIVPTLGSKEAIFSIAQVVLDPAGGKDTVVVTEPGYPVGARGARFAGGRVVELPLLEANGYLPDLDAVPDDVWARTCLLWLNYPNNPTGVVAPLPLFERAAQLAERHDFLVGSDEAYSELYTGERPVSALQVAVRRRLVVFNSLSKRSSMTGYRCGFVAADREVVAALRGYRPWTGTTPQEFVQRAAVVAWGDEEHVEEARARYALKRRVLLPVLERKGLRLAGGDATMYVWLAVRTGERSADLAASLLERGIVTTPGAALGRSGEGYVRFALVPTVEECEHAAGVLEEAL